MGAIIGTSLFNLVGYFGTFFALSVFTLLITFLLLIFKEKQEPQNQSDATSLTYWDVIKVKRASLVLLAYGLGDSILYSLEPTLALKLREDFHFSTSRIGLYFSLVFLAQIVVGITAMILPERWDLRPLLLASYFVQSAAPLMIGPSLLLHFPNTPTLVAAGLLLAGGARGVLVSFTVKEAI